MRKKCGISFLIAEHFANYSIHSLILLVIIATNFELPRNVHMATVAGNLTVISTTNDTEKKAIAEERN